MAEGGGFEKPQGGRPCRALGIDLIGCGGLCERKWSPGQPGFLNYASGGLGEPLIKAGNLERGIVLCVKLVNNEFPFGHFNLGMIKAKACARKGG